VISGVVITAGGMHKPAVIVVITAGSRTPQLFSVCQSLESAVKGHHCRLP
jgi:hypothetical protein